MKFFNNFFQAWSEPFVIFLRNSCNAVRIFIQKFFLSSQKFHISLFFRSIVRQKISIAVLCFCDSDVKYLLVSKNSRDNFMLFQCVSPFIEGRCFCATIDTKVEVSLMSRKIGSYVNIASFFYCRTWEATHVFLPPGKYLSDMTPGKAFYLGACASLRLS